MKPGDHLFIPGVEGVETGWVEINLFHQSCMKVCARVHLYQLMRPKGEHLLLTTLSVMSN